MKNLENKLQILNERLSEANQVLEDSANSNDLESNDYTLKEYVESEADSNPNFFRFLFSEDFDNDFDMSLTDKQREEYKEFLNSLY